MLLGDPIGSLVAAALLRTGGGGGDAPALVLPLRRALLDLLRRLHRVHRGRFESATCVLHARGAPRGGHPCFEGPAALRQAQEGGDTSGQCGGPP
eukprot:8956793-Pyramimonas_sp.AAC.1